MGNKIIALLGGACCGKDTIRNMMLAKYKGFVEAKSHTTRPMRATENGTEYYFIQLEDFNAMYEAGDFVETREYDVVDDEGVINETWYYGYTKDEIDSALNKGNVLMIVDLQGFKDIKEMYPDCISFYLSLDKDVKIKRYLERDEINWKNVYEAVRRIKDDEENAFVDVEDHVTLTICNPTTSTDAMQKIVDFLVLNGVDVVQRTADSDLNPEEEYYFVPSLHALLDKATRWHRDKNDIVYYIKDKSYILDEDEIQLLKQVNGKQLMKRVHYRLEEHGCIHITPILEERERYAINEWICDMPVELLEKVEVF